jgi:hypothetical protein
MKILYVADFKYHYSTETYIESAFLNQGHEVSRAMPSKPLDLALRALAKKPDLILVGKREVAWMGSFLRECKAVDVTTATWMFDLFFGYRSSRPIQMRLSDLLFSTDGGHDKEFADLRSGMAPHITLRQGVDRGEREYHVRRQLQDCAFFGTPHYTWRATYLRRLRQAYGKRFVLHDRYRGIALNMRLAECKVVIGDSYPSPNYWSNRVYETIGRGGFLLHPPTDGLDVEFTAGEHYIECPREWNEAKDCIDYWLDSSRDKRREEIRRAGFDHCGRYTYDHRVQELLDHVESYEAAKGHVR